MNIGKGDMQIEYLPYELTAEQIAKEVRERLIAKYGEENPAVLGAALLRGYGELEEIIHDGIELGLGLAGAFGDTTMADVANAYLVGTQYRENEGGI